MRRALAACTAILLLAAAPAAQYRPDFSGRWRLVEPTAAERARDTLTINAPDELLITQTPLAIIIEHPSKSGSHPESGVFKYGIGAPCPACPGRIMKRVGASRTSKPAS